MYSWLEEHFNKFQLSSIKLEYFLNCFSSQTIELEELNTCSESHLFNLTKLGSIIGYFWQGFFRGLAENLS
jgi:hypothetical protein